jgi:DNA-binding LacI/PurR family transcriptional regulator
MATIGDVARQAGVGIATVSRVMNHHPSVSPETRSKVREAVEELGYEPSRTAQALSRKRSLTIGLVAPFLTRPSVVERLRGVVEAFGDSEYDLVLWTVESPEQRRRRLGGLVQRDRLDGALLISLSLDPMESAKVRAVELPAVMIDAETPGLPGVLIDDEAGARMAAEHLIALGHRRIAYIGDALDQRFGFTAPVKRHDGFVHALNAHGLETRPSWVVVGEHGRAVAFAQATAMLSARERPTAIFCFSDTQALGVLDAAAELGLQVPGDLSVVGFDDIEAALTPGLTTVRQPLYESGRRGAEMLMSLIGGSPVGDASQELALELVVRRSTGPAPDAP